MCSYLTHILTTFISYIPTLFTRKAKIDLNSPLVEIYVVWSLDATYGMQIIPAFIFFFIKCQSTSMCLVWSCCTRFYEMFVAALLSQNNFIGSSTSMGPEKLLIQSVSDTIRHNSKFGLYTTRSHHILLLALPRDQITPYISIVTA